MKRIAFVSYGPALSMMRRTWHVPKIRPTMPIVCSIIIVLPNPWPRLAVNLGT